ncbi:hypothetical protein [Sphingomonas sp. SAFR-052]|uniref:hypothetical protein n=1 Tax=Sphingomonas sp. SAFR-052 TaxID=3436867 RepID=UPI003F80915C
MLKIAFPARLSAALLILCTYIMPAVADAQPTTGSIVTSPILIPDSNKDGILKLDGWALKVSPKLPRKTTIYGPCPGLPDFSYRVRQACAEDTAPVVVTPPVVVQPPVVVAPAPNPIFKVVRMGTERYVVGKDIVFGLNDFGGIGTLYNAPPGVSTAKSYGFLRAGIYRPSSNIEANLNGRSIEGFNIGYSIGGSRVLYSNQLLTGYYQMPGKFDDGARWTGATPTGLAIVQDVELVDSHLRFNVTLTNTTSKTMTGLRYMRTADFDTNSLDNRYTAANSFSTDNAIPSRGIVLAGLRGMGAGTTALLSSPTAGAVATFYGFVNLDPFAAAAYDAPQPVGSAKTSDVTSNVTIALGDLPPGATATVQIDIGLR